MGIGTAVITGATSGIGAEFVRQLAARGCDLVLTGRRREKLYALAEELQKTHAVAASLRALARNQVICVPGFVNRLVATFGGSALVAWVINRVVARPSRV